MLPLSGMTGALLSGNGITLDTVAFWTLAIWLYNQISGYIRQYYSYFLMTSVVVHGHSEAYAWLLTYINTTLLTSEGKKVDPSEDDEDEENPNGDFLSDLNKDSGARLLPQVKSTPLAIRNFEVVVTRRTKTPQRNNYNSAWNASTKSRPQVSFRPGLGVTMLNWRGHRILVSHEDAPNGLASAPGGANIDLTAGKRQLKLSAFRWPWSTQNVLTDLMKEVVEAHFNAQKDATSIYTLNGMYGEIWGKLAAKPKRALDSIILPDGLSEDITADAKRFLMSSAWYRQRGVPYRRGYLLHGVPGAGKSSFISGLACELSMDICLIHLSTDNLNDTMLLQRLNLAPQRALIVLEDVDAAFPKRKLDGESSDDEEEEDKNNVPYHRNSRLTLSGLLNALDGIAAQEGRIVVMTTNDVSALDPALVRSGRVDKKIEFCAANYSQARRIFLKFFPGEEDLAVTFAEQGVKSIEPATGLVMAEMQEVLLRAKDDASAAMGELVAFMDDKKAKAEKALAREKRRKERAKAAAKRRLAAKALANRNLEKAIAEQEQEEKAKAEKAKEEEGDKKKEEGEGEKNEEGEGEKKEEGEDEKKKEEDKENAATDSAAAKSGSKTPPTQDVADTVIVSVAN